MYDLISRKALLEDIKAAKENGGMGAVVADTLSRYVKRQPAVDARPVVHGEWIELHEENGHEVGTCSHCRHVRIVDNYCPNCGAKMDEGMTMKIETAINKIQKEYERTKNLEFVRNPMAYALYQVWKEADKDGGNDND